MVAEAGVTDGGTIAEDVSMMEEEEVMAPAGGTTAGDVSMTEPVGVTGGAARGAVATIDVVAMSEGGITAADDVEMTDGKRWSTFGRGV